ncbi:MAG: hypothetical protein ACI9XZ_000416 [Alphaproteobacteria bacterium]|jgi:hypothetical protein
MNWSALVRAHLRSDGRYFLRLGPGQSVDAWSLCPEMRFAGMPYFDLSCLKSRFSEVSWAAVGWFFLKSPSTTTCIHPSVL